MAKHADQLIARLGNLAIDENFEYWNELPPELKLLCIEKMDFKTRFGLRGTCVEEKTLVDSQRYNLTDAMICEGYLSIRGPAPNDNYRISFPEMISVEKVTPLVVHVLKNCNLAFFNVFFESILKQIDLETMIEDEAIRVDHLIIRDGFKSMLVFLRKCWTSVDTIGLFFNHVEKPIEHLFTIPAILNTNNLKIINLFCCQHKRLIELWMDSDAKIGAKLHFMPVFNCLGQLASMFENRIVSFENYQLRLRTPNHLEKHILMVISEKDSEVFPFCFVTIPADLPQAQYGQYIDTD